MGNGFLKRGKGFWVKGKGRRVFPFPLSPFPFTPPFFPMPHAQLPLPNAPRKVITRLVSSALTLAVNWISAEGHPFFNLDALHGVRL
ncbi:hypothetical protein PI95_005935 [Hassallia byssoidea VB512170]|uniref:Uncharacterized protein n=1 Tax=Hassallia byssoidea VB512170 TaxID=1304833 RepID=A0A846H633_9CYAN|nr:hypothetical protein [Hassalia byssoidea]NEU72124.1 hypothetical protein [Hassalia byssoidea VB512170]